MATELRRCEVEACGLEETNMPPDCYLVSFPEDDKKRSVWVDFVKGNGTTWSPDSRSRICTRHFESHHFHNNKRKARLLKSAVPSVEAKISESNRPPVSDTSPEISIWSSASYATLYGKSPLSQPLNSQMRFNGTSDEQEEYLSKVQLKKSIKGLLVHVDGLCQQFSNDPIKETEVKSMRFILLKVLHNVNLPPQEALKMFQEQIAEKHFNHLRRLVKVEKKQYKALVRSFALSLHFYSQPAYSYLRHKMRGAVPHPRTIQAWYTTIEKYMT